VLRSCKSKPYRQTPHLQRALDKQCAHVPPRADVCQLLHLRPAADHFKRGVNHIVVVRRLGLLLKHGKTSSVIHHTAITRLLGLLEKPGKTWQNEATWAPGKNWQNELATSRSCHGLSSWHCEKMVDANGSGGCRWHSNKIATSREPAGDWARCWAQALLMEGAAGPDQEVQGNLQGQLGNAVLLRSRSGPFFFIFFTNCFYANSLFSCVSQTGKLCQPH
jgi:hypothetical protein